MDKFKPKFEPSFAAIDTSTTRKKQAKRLGLQSRHAARCVLLWSMVLEADS